MQPPAPVEIVEDPIAWPPIYYSDGGTRYLVRATFIMVDAVIFIACPTQKAIHKASRVHKCRDFICVLSGRVFIDRYSKVVVRELASEVAYV